ncbi:MAG: DUF6308 family protein [Mycobacteriales bacterium]
MSSTEIDVTAGFTGDVLGAVSLDDAVRRVRAFCSDPKSGWVSFDLAAHHARQAGHFATVGPWSMLWAQALAGRVTVGDLTSFTSRMAKFADLVRGVPEDVALHEMDADARQRVARLCAFGFVGAWGPKITKVAAAYRPRAVPVLDGYVALAFGYNRESFSSVGGVRAHGRRPDRLAKVVDGLADGVRRDREFLDAVRDALRPHVPDIDLASQLRLLDMIVWTSQDDRMSRNGKLANTWRDATPGEPTPAAACAPVVL